MKEGTFLFNDALNTFYSLLYGVGHIVKEPAKIGHTYYEDHLNGRKEGHFLFNDILNTFYLLLYGVRHMIKDLLDRERGNLLLPHGLVFPISSKGSFICTIPQTG